MTARRGLVSVIVIIALAGVAQAITVRMPQDTLRVWNRASGDTAVSIRGSQILVPILVDSLTASDSIGGFEFKLVYDAGRLGASGINPDAGLIAGDHFMLKDGHTDSANGHRGFVVSVAGDGSGMITGTGVLVYITFQVLSDTAGFVRVTFDSAYTEFDKFVGPNIVKIRPPTIEGGFTFLPVGDARIMSDSIRFSQDTVVTIPVLLNEIHGDVAKAVGMKIRSDNRNVVFTGVDTTDTQIARMAREGWVLWSTADSGKSITIQTERSTDVQVLSLSEPFIRLKMLVHGTADIHSAVTFDSLIVRGFQENFSISSAGALLDLVYARTIGVLESVGAVDHPFVFPNPANGGVTVLDERAGSGILGYEILDLHGRSVTGWLEERSGRAAINTAKLPAGSYLVRWRTAAGPATSRLTVVH